MKNVDKDMKNLDIHMEYNEHGKVELFTVKNIYCKRYTKLTKEEFDKIFKEFVYKTLDMDFVKENSYSSQNSIWMCRDDDYKLVLHVKDKSVNDYIKFMSSFVHGEYEQYIKDITYWYEDNGDYVTISFQFEDFKNYKGDKQCI